MMENHELVRKLEEGKQGLFQRLQKLEATSALVNDESRGDFGDQGQSSQYMADFLRAKSIIVNQIEEIDLGLEAVRNGRFGLCCGCSKPIDPARVEANPHALFCIRCLEKRARKRFVFAGL